MNLRPGMRLRSAVSDAEIVVIKAPSDDVELTCGGVEMIEATETPPEPPSTVAGEVLLGKRYSDDDLGLEVLCSRGGAGDLSVNGAPLGLKAAKPLPSSD